MSTISTPDGASRLNLSKGVAASVGFAAAGAGVADAKTPAPASAGKPTAHHLTTEDGTSLYLKDWGSGPAVVFSRGYPLSSDAWEDQMFFLLQNGYRVIAHDRRGFGRSSQLLAQCLEGAKLVEGMESFAVDVLGEGILLREAVRAHNARDGLCVLVMRFCFTSSSSARNRRPPAGTSNMPVSWPSAPSTGRTFRLCRSVRRAMSSASSSMDTPALTRRTLDWLSTGLLKGMSREELRVIFRTAVAILIFSATGGREPLSRPPTCREVPHPALTLPACPPSQARQC
jgi:hypothetical protein